MNQILRNEIITWLQEVIDLLYQENVSVAYGKLTTILPNIGKLAAELQEEERQALLDGLQPALEAMEQQDATLLADVLQYELLEKLQGYE